MATWPTPSLCRIKIIAKSFKYIPLAAGIVDDFETGSNDEVLSSTVKMSFRTSISWSESHILKSKAAAPLGFSLRDLISFHL